MEIFAVQPYRADKLEEGGILLAGIADVVNPEPHSILGIRRSFSQHFSSEIRLLAMCLANRNAASFEIYKVGIPSFRNMHAAE